MVLKKDLDISADDFIRKLDAEANKEKDSTGVDMHFVRPLGSGESPENIRLNAAFYWLTEELIPLVLQLLKLWRLCDISIHGRPILEAIRVFGPEMKSFIGRRLLFTVTSDQKELRCWYGIPGYSTPDHVDSYGQGLLFWIRADPDKTKYYIQELLSEEMQAQVVYLKNGTAIYGFFSS